MGLKLLLFFLGLIALARAKSYNCSDSSCDNLVSLVYNLIRDSSGPVNNSFNVYNGTSKQKLNCL